MTRIGRVIIGSCQDPNMPIFKLVVENGHVQLGCWQFVGWKDEANYKGAIYERVS